MPLRCWMDVYLLNVQNAAIPPTRTLVEMNFMYTLFRISLLTSSIIDAPLQTLRAEMKITFFSKHCICDVRLHLNCFDNSFLSVDGICSSPPVLRRFENLLWIPLCSVTLFWLWWIFWAWVASGRWDT